MGGVLPEFLCIESPRGDGDAGRAQSPGAGDVLWGIADDDDFMRMKRATAVGGGPRGGDRSELVPIGEIAAIATERKKTIKPEVPHLGGGTVRGVSC